MRPVHIDLVPSSAWQVIWLIAAVFMLSIAGLTGWQVWKQRQVQSGLQAELVRLQAELRLGAVPEEPVVNPREASERAALRLMQRDWNLLFDTVENPALSDVRLVQLSFDSDTGQARVEYEIVEIATGPLVTSALNENTSGVVWRLEQLKTSPATTSANKVRGTWLAQFP